MAKTETKRQAAVTEIPDEADIDTQAAGLALAMSELGELKDVEEPEERPAQVGQPGDGPGKSYESEHPPPCSNAVGLDECRELYGIPRIYDSSTTDKYGKYRDWCWRCWWLHCNEQLQKKNTTLRDVLKVVSKDIRILGGGTRLNLEHVLDKIDLALKM